MANFTMVHFVSRLDFRNLLKNYRCEKSHRIFELQEVNFNQKLPKVLKATFSINVMTLKRKKPMNFQYTLDHNKSQIC